MARDFVKSGTSFISLGMATINSLISGASASWLAAWIIADTISADFNQIWGWPLDGTKDGGDLFIDATNHLTVFGHPDPLGLADVATSIGTISTGTLNHVAGVADYANKILTPYLNGVADNPNTSPTWVNTTYVPGSPAIPDYVGGNSLASVTRKWDGMIAEVLVGTGDPGPAFFKQLAAGFDPLLVPLPSGSTIKMYLDLGRFGLGDPIGGVTGTLVGSNPIREHPLIHYQAGVNQIGQSSDLLIASLLGQIRISPSLGGQVRMRPSLGGQLRIVP